MKLSQTSNHTPQSTSFIPLIQTQTSPTHATNMTSSTPSTYSSHSHSQSLHPLENRITKLISPFTILLIHQPAPLLNIPSPYLILSKKPDEENRGFRLDLCFDSSPGSNPSTSIITARESIIHTYKVRILKAEIFFIEGRREVTGKNLLLWVEQSTIHNRPFPPHQISFYQHDIKNPEKWFKTPQILQLIVKKDENLINIYEVLRSNIIPSPETQISLNITLSTHQSVMNYLDSLQKKRKRIINDSYTTSSSQSIWSTCSPPPKKPKNLEFNLGQDNYKENIDPSDIPILLTTLGGFLPTITQDTSVPKEEEVKKPKEGEYTPSTPPKHIDKKPKLQHSTLPSSIISTDFQKSSSPISSNDSFNFCIYSPRDNKSSSSSKSVPVTTSNPSTSTTKPRFKKSFKPVLDILHGLNKINISDDNDNGVINNNTINTNMDVDINMNMEIEPPISKKSTTQLTVQDIKVLESKVPGGKFKSFADSAIWQWVAEGARSEGRELFPGL